MIWPSRASCPEDSANFEGLELLKWSLSIHKALAAAISSGIVGVFETTLALLDAAAMFQPC